MNYTWQIFNLGLKDQMNSEGQLLEDAVVSVQWKKIATADDGAVATYVGQTDLSASDVAISDFTPLSSVTKEQVVGWVENAIPSGEMAAIDQILENKINKSRIRTHTPNWK